MECLWQDDGGSGGELSLCEWRGVVLAHVSL